MKLTRLLAPALGVAMIAASAGTATAAPDKPQRLRGMEDRSFAVEVTLPDGSSFPNCYTFEADGTWIDPAAPEGVWSQRGAGWLVGRIRRCPRDGLHLARGRKTSRRVGETSECRTAPRLALRQRVATPDA